MRQPVQVRCACGLRGKGSARWQRPTPPAYGRHVAKAAPASALLPCLVDTQQTGPRQRRRAGPVGTKAQQGCGTPRRAAPALPHMWHALLQRIQPGSTAAHPACPAAAAAPPFPLSPSAAAPAVGPRGRWTCYGKPLPGSAQASPVCSAQDCLLLLAPPSTAPCSPACCSPAGSMST